MQKKYPNSALWRCLKAYPDAELFKLFMGQCYAMGFTRARYMDDILKNHFKDFTQSQKEWLLKKYDDQFLKETFENWTEFRKQLSHERVHFLYTKIKYRKVMRLNVCFNEKEYNWPVMQKVFDVIFTSSKKSDLLPLVKELPDDLVKNIFDFFDEVNKLRGNK